MKLSFSRKNAWEGLPERVRRPLGSLLGLVPLPYVLGSGFRHVFRFVQEAQWWPAERSREYQLEQVRSVLLLAQQKTPFYRRTFAGAGFDPHDLRALEDLAGLPTTDKQTLRDHLAEMCAVPPQSPRVDYVTTGGTGGTPLGFYIGAQRSAVEYAHLVSGWQRMGFRLGRPLAVFRGRVVPLSGALRHFHDPLLRHHYYSNFHMTDDNMGRYLDHVAGLGECFLHVYPSSAAALARFIKRSGRTPPRNVRGVMAESEILYPEQRSLVEETFGVRCFASYGHTEKLVAATECESSTDYHVWPTYGFLELIDEQGRPVTTPGQRGEIVGTGFINRVVPFIRYRTGDFATFLAPSCASCGRAHMLLGDIRGHRVQELLIAHDGAAISWTAVNMHDDTFARVVRFQFFQDTPGRARLRVVPGPGFGDQDRRRIQERLAAKLSGRLEFEIDLVEQIAVTGMGKAIYVDQRIPTAAS